MLSAEDAPPKVPEWEIMIGDEIAIPDLLRQVTKVTGKSIIWSDQDKVVTTRKIQGSQRLRAPGEW